MDNFYLAATTDESWKDGTEIILGSKGVKTQLIIFPQRAPERRLIRTVPHFVIQLQPPSEESTRSFILSEGDHAGVEFGEGGGDAFDRIWIPKGRVTDEQIITIQQAFQFVETSTYVSVCVEEYGFLKRGMQ